MGKTAVGLYETSAEAQQVLNELVKAGFSRNTIRIMIGDQSTRQVRMWSDTLGGTANTQSSGALASGARSVLVSAGVPSDDAQDYEEALHHGNALVSITTTDERINQAVEIMNRHNILNVRERAQLWNRTAGAERDLRTGEEATLPVIEEEMRVGKREVERGGVRVSTHVTETPVDETVNLREEHVHVERRPVDRAVTTGDVNKLRDQTIEVRETAEEAVIDKQARVVEEVVVRKDVDTRQERIQDTVRRTDVNVEKIGDQSIQGWDRFSDDFRTHYTTNFAKSGRAYTYYEPAYRYGYGLAARPDWRGRSWAEIEADAQSGWDPVHGPWDEFKQAVRHAWQRATT